MAQQVVDTTTGAGDTGQAGGNKINANFTELYKGFLGKDNATTTDPGVANDNTQGYAVGSGWFNSTTGVLFSCRDASTGAAVWVARGAKDINYVAGNWYPFANIGGATGLAPGAGAACFLPFTVAERFTISDLASLITTASAGGNFQMGIFGSDANWKASGLPLAYTSSALSTASATIVSGNLNANLQLSPGVKYNFACATDNGTVVFAAPSVAQPLHRIHAGIGPAVRLYSVELQLRL
jgi:hypothetical protein